MKKLGCLIILCCLLTGAGLVWSLPPIASNSTGTTSDNETIRSVATQLITGGTLSSAKVGDGNFTVDSSGNILMRTASYIRDTTNPFCQQFYAGTDYDDNYTEICAPATGYTETYSLRLPAAAPTGNQVMVFPVPTAGVSQGTWGSASGTGDLISTNNLSDIADNATARSNLGLEIGVDVPGVDGGLTNGAVVCVNATGKVGDCGNFAWDGNELDVNGSVLVGGSGAKLGGNNGVAILSGIGDGYDENLTFDFNTTENSVAVASTTGVTGITTALNLITTGTIQGDINVVNKSDNSTLATTEMRGSLVVVSAAKTMTLPAVETGNSACIYSSGANVVEVRPNANDGFVLAGAARDTDGQGIYSDGTAGAFICFFGDSADGWTTLGSKGTWASR